MPETLPAGRMPLAEEFGSVLVTRKLGAKVADAMAGMLADMTPPSLLVVDCAGVEIMDYSFADEAAGKVVARMAAGEFGEAYFVLANLSGELRENIECSLKLRELTAVSVSESGWQVLGPLKPHLGDVIGVLSEMGVVTARDVAGALGIALNTASNRLIELHRLGIARRKNVPVNGGGKQYAYEVVGNNGLIFE